MADKFLDRWWAGVGAGLLCVVVLIFAFNWGYQIGHQFGWEQAVRELREGDGGIYVGITLEGSPHELKGFVK